MWKQNLSSKISIFGLLCLLIFLGNLKYSQWKNANEIEKNIASLKEQEQQKSQKANELAELKNYLDSRDFKEKVAREQLGYKKNSELVYGFTEVQESTQQKPITNEKSSNFKKWWDYFFSE